MTSAAWSTQAPTSPTGRPLNSYSTQSYVPTGYVQLHHTPSHYAYPYHQPTPNNTSPVGSREAGSPPFSESPVPMYALQYTGYQTANDYQRLAPSQQYPFSRQGTQHLRHMSEDSTGGEIATPDDKGPHDIMAIRMKKEKFN